MNVSIIGTGYVGLVTGACLAEKGHHVVCVDIDGKKVDQINRSTPPIYEEGLESLLKRNVPERLRATTDLEQAVWETDLSLIGVGTPFSGDRIDLSYVQHVARHVGQVLAEKSSFHVVTVKSTVVPGTTEDVVMPLLEEASGKRAGSDFGVSVNPEFLREGSAVSDFMNPDRIVLGGIDERSLERLGRLYDVFEGVEVLKTNPRTAEMIKYASNSLLATMISFSNEIGNLCASLGEVDAEEVMRGVQLDERLTPRLPDGERLVPDFLTYLKAGCGFGGSCLPKDVRALVAHGRQSGQSMPLLSSVMQVNDRQPEQMMELLARHFPTLAGQTVAVLGLAYKPGTDDTAESPAIPLIRTLAEKGATVRAYDPVVSHSAAQALFEDLEVAYPDTLEEAVKGVDAALLVTSWDEFEALPALFDTLDEPPLLVDGRRMIEKERVPRYSGIGMWEEAPRFAERVPLYSESGSE